MILDVPLAALLALAAAVFVGAAVQGLVGLGLGLVLAPMTGLVAPELIPGLPLWLAMSLPLLTLTRDWRHVDWRGLSWAVGARVPGTALGVVLVASVSAIALNVVVGVVVLLAVVLSSYSVSFAPRPPALIAAGLVSGVSGTASSIGGPPMAVLYQREPPDVLRSTLGVYFVVGAALSLIGLTITGQLPGRDLLVALVLVPALVLGFLASVPLRRRLDPARVRVAVLILCALSAVTLILRSLLAG